DRDVDAHVLQPRQHVSRKLRILHDRAFRQLQLEKLRRPTRLFENPDHRLGQILIVKLSCGDVDSNLNRRESLFTPALALQTSSAQDPFTNWHDQARVFSQRNELGWRNESELWMLPAHE